MVTARHVTYVSDCRLHYDLQARNHPAADLLAARDKAVSRAMKTMSTHSPLSDKAVRDRYRAAAYLEQVHLHNGGDGLVRLRNQALAELEVCARSQRFAVSAWSEDAALAQVLTALGQAPHKSFANLSAS